MVFRVLRGGGSAAPRRGAHTIVIGGGVAGLAAARVLSEHFREVTVIERDRYPEAPAFRSGVPHGGQFHMWLIGGQRLLEGLFPGIDADMEASSPPPDPR